MSAAMGFFPYELKNEFEKAVVNESSVLEPLKFYCICTTTNRILGFRRRYLVVCPQDVKESGTGSSSPGLLKFSLGTPKYTSSMCRKGQLDS